MSRNSGFLAGPGPGLYAEPVRGGLQDRRLGGLVDLGERSWRVVLVDRGRVRLTAAAASEEIAGPALLWLPWRDDMRLTARAGMAGALLILGERALTSALGMRPEATDLRLTADRRVLLPLDGETGLRPLAGQLFGLILREAAERADGSETVIEAQVRVLLVMLWRAAAPARGEVGTQGPAPQALRQFRQLLEVHFRDRWKVARYAEALGLTPDRLHDICTRELGRPPQQLIHERLVHEAETLLARSARTVDQVAQHLGFRTAAQFSAFFRQRIGLPPATYRRRLRAGGGLARAPERSHADWP